MLANRLKLFWALLGNQLWVRPTLWSLLSVAAVAVALHFGNSLMADGAPEVDVDTLSSMLTVIASALFPYPCCTRCFRLSALMPRPERRR